MPTDSILQVFLLNVMCCSSFKHEKPGRLGYVNIGKPVSYDSYVHVYATFSFRSQ